MKRIILLLSLFIVMANSLMAETIELEKSDSAAESGIKYGYDLFMMGAGAIVVGAVAAAMLTPTPQVSQEVASSLNVE